MPTIEERITALETAQLQRNAQPALVLFCRDDQPSPEQAEQIAQAEREGRTVKIILTRIIE